LFVVVPQFHTFQGSLATLQNLNIIWLVPLAAALTMTYVFSTICLVVLSPKHLPFGRTITVQLAGSFVNKMLPSGLGMAALFVRYLQKSGYRSTKAISLMAVQRTIDFVMFIMPLGLVLLLMGGRIQDMFKVSLQPWTVALGVVIILVLILLGLAFKRWRERVVNYLQRTYVDFRRFVLSPKRLAVSALSSLGVSLAYVVCLYCCLHAVGLDISPLAALVVYATAILIGSAAPTPGGLGVIEATIAATLIGLGFGQVESYAGVILYRLITFWLPVPFGVIAYQYLQKRKFI
jgi:undecaprenyl-diphosphatase